jgi:valyl-tRNA synthetase
LQGDISSDDQYAVQHTLLFVLDQILRVAHPVIPFITDTLWQDIKAPLDLNGESIMLAPYPEVQTDWENKTAQIQFSWLQDVVTALRTVRSEMQIKPSQGVNLVVLKANDADKAAFKALGNLIKSLARVEAISFDKNVGGATATAVVGNMECHIPLEGLIDMGAEKARLEKEVDRLTSEVKRFEGKLSNPNFVDRAPADVVDKEKQKLLRAKEALATLQAQLNNI